MQILLWLSIIQNFKNFRRSCQNIRQSVPSNSMRYNSNSNSAGTQLENRSGENFYTIRQDINSSPVRSIPNSSANHSHSGRKTFSVQIQNMRRLWKNCSARDISWLQNGIVRRHRHSRIVFLMAARWKTLGRVSMHNFWVIKVDRSGSQGIPILVLVQNCRLHCSATSLITHLSISSNF